MSNSFKRSYSTILRFENWNYYDDSGNTNWTMVGGTDAIQFDQDSIFNETLGLKRNCMHISHPYAYLENKMPEENISLGDTGFTITAWIKFDTSMIVSYLDNCSFSVPFIRLTDSNDKVFAIKLLDHKSSKDLVTQTASINVDNKTYYCNYGDYIGQDEWFHFMYSRDGDENRLWINGALVGHYNIPSSQNIVYTAKSIIFGCPDSSTQNNGMAYCVDDICVLNQSFEEDNYYTSDKPFSWVYPPVNMTNILENILDPNYKYGSSTGLVWTYCNPIKISGSILYFGPNMYGSMLFINNTFIEPQGWERLPDIPKSPEVRRIQLLSSVDVSRANYSYFTLVGLRPKTVTGFGMNIQQTTTNGTSVSHKVPSLYNSYKVKDGDAFILFDGSLAVVQPDRYTVNKHSDGNYYVDMKNTDDYLGTHGMRLTWIFVKGNSTDKEILFKKLVCPIDKQGYAELPSFTAHSERFGSIGFTIDSALFFVDGSYMPPDYFTLNDQHQLVINTLKYGDDNLALHNEVELILIESTDGRDYNPKDDMDYRITGSSLFEELLHLRITRKEDYIDPINMEEDMYNKILWYENNKIPASNFNYRNKFNIKWKE